MMNVLAIDDRRRLLEAFMSLEHPLVEEFQSEEMSYRALKVLNL